VSAAVSFALTIPREFLADHPAAGNPISVANVRWTIGREQRTLFAGGGVLCGRAADEFVPAIGVAHQPRRAARGNRCAFELHERRF
jgi:hypothetical protein